MRLRWVLGVAVALSLLACSDDGAKAKTTQTGSAGQDVKAPTSSSDDLETWTHAGPGGSIAHVKITPADAMRPCTMITVGNVGYAALWPASAIREKTGVRVGSHLYPFDSEVALRGRKYDGGQTTTACLATDLWMVLEGA
jgi:hypothetical protein